MSTAEKGGGGGGGGLFSGGHGILATADHMIGIILGVCVGGGGGHRPPWYPHGHTSY